MKAQIQTPKIRRFRRHGRMIRMAPYRSHRTEWADRSTERICKALRAFDHHRNGVELSDWTTVILLNRM